MTSKPPIAQPCVIIGQGSETSTAEPATAATATAESVMGGAPYPFAGSRVRQKATVVLGIAQSPVHEPNASSSPKVGSGTQFIDSSWLPPQHAAVVSNHPESGLSVDVPQQEAVARPVRGERNFETVQPERVTPAQVEPVAAPLAPARFAAAVRSAGIPLAEARPMSQTTVAEVPVVRTPPSSPAEVSAHGSFQPQRQRALDAGMGPTAACPLGAATAKRIVAQTPPSALAKLGVITQRYPVGVVGGAMLGTLILFVFLVGAAQVLGLSPMATQTNVNPGQPATTALGARPSAARAPTNDSNSTAHEAQPDAAASTVAIVSAPLVASSRQAALDPIMQPARAQAMPASANDKGPDPNLRTAVGHLFSGRLPEAEQAYRDLAARHPGDLTYSTMVRLLARRNSPDCRPTNRLQKACPVVKS